MSWTIARLWPEFCDEQRSNSSEQRLSDHSPITIPKVCNIRTKMHGEMGSWLTPRSGSVKQLSFYCYCPHRCYKMLRATCLQNAVWAWKRCEARIHTLKPANWMLPFSLQHLRLWMQDTVVELMLWNQQVKCSEELKLGDFVWQAANWRRLDRQNERAQRPQQYDSVCQNMFKPHRKRYGPMNRQQQVIEDVLLTRKEGLPQYVFMERERH